MARHNHENSALSVMDAVDALSSIAELDFPREISIATPEEVIQQNNMVTNRVAEWVKIEDPDHTVKLIKDTFHLVLIYLKDFYKRKYRSPASQTEVEGVKNIMLSAGEAAKKIDKYTTLFSQTKEKRVTSLKEYKQLQDFYQTRIVRRIDESRLSNWLLEMTKGIMEKNIGKIVAKEKKAPVNPAEHVFIDMEEVIKDTDYELFFLHKEDGTRFFNPRLIRNMKLVSDFGENLTRIKEIDPLKKIKQWQDFSMHNAAKSILVELGPLLNSFVHAAQNSSAKELCGNINKAVIALLMAGKSENLLQNAPVKSCLEYFLDFIFFLRLALHSDEYRKMLVYPPSKMSALEDIEIRFLHAICNALFTGIHEDEETNEFLKEIFHEAAFLQSEEHEVEAKKHKTIWNSLAAQNAAMLKMLKLHPNGPLLQDLEILSQGIFHAFDPIGQYNIPNHLYYLYLKETTLSNIRIPSPTRQEFINKAEVLEEFKGFIRSLKNGKKQGRHLLINLQDRNSWREMSRAKALESLQDTNDFKDNIVVVTLDKDSPFYRQDAPFDEDKKATVFLKRFKENLQSQTEGYYFPKIVQRAIFPKFVDEVLSGIHRVFFSGKNVLTKESRMEFIEIFHFFLELKLLEIIRPHTFSHTCKDGVDTGACASVGLFAFINLINGKKCSEEELEKMNQMLYQPAILIRERTILAERFNRMNGAIRRIEAVQHEMGTKNFVAILQEAFEEWFKTPILKASAL